MKNRVISLFLCLVVFCGMYLCLPIAASTNAMPLSSLEGPSVSAGMTYSISTADELLKFASLCTRENNWCAGVTFIITENIDLNKDWTASATAPAVTWTPIPLFSGVLDGGGHTVSGFYIHGGLDWKNVLDTSASISGVEKAAGIFCSIGGENTEIKNLNITNSYIRSEKIVGTVAGITSNETASNRNLKISNVTSSAIVISDDSDAGGIVGVINSPQTNYPITIENCTFAGDVSVAKNNVGGMVGVTWRKIAITGCVNSGRVWSRNDDKSVNVGGMIGYFTGGNGNLAMERCVNKGEVFTEYCINNVNGGGMIGLTANSITVSDCVNVGSVEVRRSAANAELQAVSCSLGGILGSNQSIESSVEVKLIRCANLGEVMLIPCTVVAVVESGCCVGGIVGKVSDGAPVSFTDCASSGTLTAGRSVCGGIVGTCFTTTGNFTRCVFVGDFDGGNDFLSGGFAGNINYSGTNTDNKLTFTDCVYASQNFTNYLNKKNATLYAVGNYVAANASKRYIDVCVSGDGATYAVIPSDLMGTYYENLKSLNQPFVDAQSGMDQELLLGADAVTTLSTFDFENTWCTLAEIPVPKSISVMISTTDVPALGDDNTPSDGGNQEGTSGGNNGGTISPDGEKTPEDSENSNGGTKLPDVFDPSLIIGSNKKDPDVTEETTLPVVSETEDTSTTDSNRNIFGCGAVLNSGSWIVVGLLLLAMIPIMKKRTEYDQ